MSLDLMLTMQRKDVKITVVYMNVMNASDLEGWCHGLGAIYHFFKAAFTSLVEPLCSKTDTIEHCETIKGSALTATWLILRQARAIQYVIHWMLLKISLCNYKMLPKTSLYNYEHEVIFIVDVT